MFKKLLPIVATIIGASFAGLLIRNIDYVEYLGRMFLSEVTPGEFRIKDSEIERAKQQIGLPLSLNDTVLWTDLEFEDGMVFYHYNLLGFKLDENLELEAQILKNIYRNEILKNLCGFENNSPNEWFYKNIPYNYQYHDEDGRYFFSFVISNDEDC